MTIRTNLKAGAFQRGGGWANHNEVLRVRSQVSGGYFPPKGGIILNHNEALRVRSQVKGGIIRVPIGNHNEALRVRSTVKAGIIINY